MVNLSELDPAWDWLRAPLASELPDWWHASALRPSALGVRWQRWQAVRQARALIAAAPGAGVLVSHGPRPAAYWGSVPGAPRPALHCVYSFNYTDLPEGASRRLQARAFRQVDHFVVASTWERQLYARHFDIDPARIGFQPWGVQQPDEDEGPALIPGSYLCALGSQARDYATLIAAMRRLPALRLVLVATPASVQGLDLPANVQLLTQVPLATAMNVLRHSRLMVLPLRDTEARCGHVTAVAALHRGVPIVATDCRGLDDYLRPGETALSVPAVDELALARAIAALHEDDDLRASLSRRGLQFARAACTEAAVVAGFRRLLAGHGLLPTSPGS